MLLQAKTLEGSGVQNLGSIKKDESQTSVSLKQAGKKKKKKVCLYETFYLCAESEDYIHINLFNTYWKSSVDHTLKAE